MKLTSRNTYGEAIIEFDRADSIQNVIEKLAAYEESLENVEYYRSDYDELTGLNDDNLSQRVIHNNDVQNALCSFMNLVDDIVKIQES